MNLKIIKILIICCSCFLVSVGNASDWTDKAYLYIFFHDDNSNGERFRTQMPNMKICLEALKHAKMPMATSPGGDYEVMGAMWCGTEKFSAYHNNIWWTNGVMNDK